MVLLTTPASHSRLLPGRPLYSPRVPSHLTVPLQGQHLVHYTSATCSLAGISQQVTSPMKAEIIHLASVDPTLPATWHIQVRKKYLLND